MKRFFYAFEQSLLKVSSDFINNIDIRNFWLTPFKLFILYFYVTIWMEFTHVYTLVFWLIRAQGLNSRIGTFHNIKINEWTIHAPQINSREMKKWPYLGPWAFNHKNKTTLFSSILKVGGNKVVLFFWYKAQEPSYGRFLVFVNEVLK